MRRRVVEDVVEENLMEEEEAERAFFKKLGKKIGRPRKSDIAAKLTTADGVDIRCAGKGLEITAAA